MSNLLEGIFVVVCSFALAGALLTGAFFLVAYLDRIGVIG
jgi:hypothetical protein